jgi:hypothetical protein
VRRRFGAAALGRSDHVALQYAAGNDGRERMSICHNKPTLASAAAAISDRAIRERLGLRYEERLPTSFQLAIAIAELAEQVDNKKSSILAAERRLERDQFDRFAHRALDAEVVRLLPLQERLDALTRGLSSVRHRERRDPRFRCEFLSAFATAVAKELARTDPSTGVQFRLTHALDGFPHARVATDVRFLVTDAVEVVRGGYEQPLTHAGPPRSEEVFQTKPPFWTKWTSVTLMYVDWASGEISSEPPKRAEDRGFWYWLKTISETFLFVVDIVTLQGIVRRAIARGVRYILTRTPTLLKAGKQALKGVERRVLASAQKSVISVKLNAAPKNSVRPLSRPTPKTAVVDRLGRVPAPAPPPATGKAGNRARAADKVGDRATGWAARSTPQRTGRPSGQTSIAPGSRTNTTSVKPRPTPTGAETSIGPKSRTITPASSPRSASTFSREIAAARGSVVKKEPYLEEIERLSGARIRDPSQVAAAGTDAKVVWLPEGTVLEAYGPAKTRFQWSARVPEENLAMGAAQNQLNLWAWYGREGRSIDLYRYTFKLDRPMPAVMSKIAPQPGIRGTTVGPPKFQYYNPAGFENYGRLGGKVLVGRLPPSSAR